MEVHAAMEKEKKEKLVKVRHFSFFFKQRDTEYTEYYLRSYHQMFRDKLMANGYLYVGDILEGLLGKTVSKADGYGWSVEENYVNSDRFRFFEFTKVDDGYRIDIYAKRINVKDREQRIVCEDLIFKKHRPEWSVLRALARRSKDPERAMRNFEIVYGPEKKKEVKKAE